MLDRLTNINSSVRGNFIYPVNILKDHFLEMNLLVLLVYTTTSIAAGSIREYLSTPSPSQLSPQSPQFCKKTETIYELWMKLPVMIGTKSGKNAGNEREKSGNEERETSGNKNRERTGHEWEKNRDETQEIKGIIGKERGKKKERTRNERDESGSKEREKSGERTGKYMCSCSLFPIMPCSILSCTIHVLKIHTIRRK